MSKIDYQALREAAQNAKNLGGIKNYKRGEQAVTEFESLITPRIVLALLDERERNQQYIKRRDQENEDIALTVGKLRVELEGKDKLIAELGKQCAEWERKALSNFEECAAMAERIEELEQANTGQDTNINSQQERVTQSANRHVYHYNAVSDVGGIAMSGIAQLPFRIKSQSDLEEFKSALSKVCGFHATAVTSLSYLGREGDHDHFSNEVREDGNQFLVVRHPGKSPVIKHCTGDLEEFLRKLIEQDPLVTIDIITHRYYGVGGQWVQDAGEYLHMMSDAGIRIKGE
ncbi:ead/Ea22-like family protein [Escherichia coli]